MTTAKIELPPKLVDVFTGEARYRGAYGGRGSGKTRSFALMSAVRGYQFAMEGKSGQILCAREFQNSLTDSSFVEVKEAIRSVDWLNDFYDIGENYIRTKCGNVRYVFKGLARNIDSVKSMGRILLCWVDEAENVSEYSWQKLTPTVREDDSEIWATWNPESDESATHARFRLDKPTESKIVELNYTDNPWFPKVLDQERLDDKDKRPETYNWIWEGDFNRNQIGSIYAQYVLNAEEAGRITSVPYKDGVPVFTAWDLGNADSTAIWFCQIVGFQPRIIDYVEDSQKDLAHYSSVINSKPYKYIGHYLPHDSKHERLGMEGSIKSQLEKMGHKCFALGAESVAAGIEEARDVLKTCYIDKDACKGGLKALRNYKYAYDEKRKTFSQNPYHDWASHGSDAFRYLASAINKRIKEGNAEPAVDVSPRVILPTSGGGGWMY